MPIYEFECACKNQIELILPMKEFDSHPECPECGSAMNRRVELTGNPVVPITGKEKVMADLNSRNDGRGNYPHHKAALWKGVNQSSEVRGRGFG